MLSRIVCFENGCTLPKMHVDRLLPMEGNSVESSLTWLLCIKFNEIYVRYLDAK